MVFCTFGTRVPNGTIMNLKLEDEEVRKRISENELVRILQEHEEYERGLPQEEQLTEVKTAPVVVLTNPTKPIENTIYRYLSNRNATN